MNSFLLNALTEEYLYGEVKRFLAKDFPRLNDPKQWRLEYYSKLESVIKSAFSNDSVQYLDEAKWQFAESFETVLGKALATVLIDCNIGDFWISPMLFTPEAICELLVKAKDLSFAMLAEDPKKHLTDVFTNNLCQELEKFLARCKKFQSSVAVVPPEENNEQSVPKDEVNEKKETAENSTQTDGVNTGEESEPEATAEAKKKSRATVKKKSKADDDSKEKTSDSKVKVGLCLHPIFGLGIIVEDEEGGYFFI